MSEKNEKKLFLVDAMALIYRAHFAFSKNPRISSSGLNTSSIFGFANSILEIIKKEKPTHLAVAFDTPKPTFRHKQYEEYKANRQEQPEDIRTAIPYVKKLLDCFQIPVFGVDGFEADDVIGTLANKACKAGFPKVYMMTMDKDYSQLVNDCVLLYKPSYMGNGHEIYDVNKVLEKFNIKKVDQVRDILGLMGDSSDNIPGIPGVGPKTAQKLINEFGTVEELVANADLLKGKLKERVMEHKDQAVLSKELATIHIDVPVEFDEEAFLYRGVKEKDFSDLCDELEFRQLKRRVLGEKVSVSSSSSDGKKEEGQMGLFSSGEQQEEKETAPVLDTLDSTVHDYHIIDSKEARRSLLDYLKLQDEICFDTETTGLDAYEAKLVGVSVSYFSGEAYYIPVDQDDEKAREVIDDLKEIFENEKITKIGQNIKFDIIVLRKYGIEVKGKLFCTMLAHYLLEPDMRHNMDVLSESYLNYSPVPIETLIGKKGPKQKNMKDVPVSFLAEYAAEDADITYRLKQLFAPALKESGLDKLYDEVEMPLMEVLADMECAGVKVDTDTLSELSGKLQNDIEAVEERIYSAAGEQFNIASPKQLGDILFDKLKIDIKAKKTRTGQYATGEEILARLASEHEIAKDILVFRELQKLKSTYVDSLPQLISKSDGRIHTCYNQAVAATGRLSSTNPNLQNIPVRTDRGREIRKAFVPQKEGYVLLSADYSQIELRIMAAFSGEENMVRAFQNGEDIHTTTAAKIYDVPDSEVTQDMRRNAKTVNFGIIYGVTPFGLSQRLNISRAHATEIIESYFDKFPKIKTYMDRVINEAREQEYVKTILGRRRYLRDINSRNMTMRGYAERNAINAPIQGSAADMIKVAMINISQWLKSSTLQTKMIMQVHDELVFEAPESELEEVKNKVEELMKSAIELEVPMEVGMGSGKNWLEAH